jgi:c-di-GMP-binding flagellar brake protein YcgR
MDLESLVREGPATYRLDVEVGTNLVLVMEGVETFLRSKLVGLLHDRFLIILTPRLSGAGNDIFQGKQIVVKCLARGCVYSFQSDVISQVNSPARLLFLSYPAVVSKTDLRKTPRFPTGVPAEVYLAGKSVPAVVADISQGGCKVLLKGNLAKLAAGDRLSIGFLVSELSPLSSAEVVVKNCQVRSGQTEIGCSFEELGEEPRRALAGFLKPLTLFVK